MALTNRMRQLGGQVDKDRAGVIDIIATEETAVVFGSIEQVRIGGGLPRASILLPPVFGNILPYNALRIGRIGIGAAPDAVIPRKGIGICFMQYEGETHAPDSLAIAAISLWYPRSCFDRV